jgi:hypothetical protein
MMHPVSVGRSLVQERAAHDGDSDVAEYIGHGVHLNSSGVDSQDEVSLDE